MSLLATWLITCDECGRTKSKTIILNDDTVDGSEKADDGVITYHISIWSPGLPDDWIQYVVEDSEIWRPDPNRSHYFFEKEECCLSWLRKHGQEELAKRFEEAVWVARGSKMAKIHLAIDTKREDLER